MKTGNGRSHVAQFTFVGRVLSDTWLATFRPKNMYRKI